MKCEAPDCDRDSRSKFRDGPSVCGLHYQRLLKHGTFDNPPRIDPGWARCSVDGCSNKARTKLGELCETHYYRVRRTGTTAPREYRKGKYVGSHGYVMSHEPDHPASSPTGTLYEHRRVLYDELGGGVHQCHWCKRDVSWDIKVGPDKLVVDHLDNNKQNNDIGNLVPSCHSCNSCRGLFANWVTKSIATIHSFCVYSVQPMTTQGSSNAKRRDARSNEAQEYRRLYHTAKWQRLRQAKLAQDPLCEWCLEREIVEPATEVHHADGGHKGDVTKFWSGPFVSTCKPCHASRGQREDKGTYIAFGADGWPV